MIDRMTALEPDVHALLTGANFVHLATLMPDGSPHSIAVWAGVHDHKPCFFTQPSSQKARNLDRDPRLAMSVVDRTNPYRTARVRGRVATVVTGAAALAIIDDLAVAYTGASFPMRSGQVYLVDVEHQGLMELPFKDTPPSP
jgi:PPOX class probable F420-dependent enzyme